MLREFLSKLSGGQITMIVMTSILVPGAVGAAVTFQSVAIVEPASGRQSYIDGGRRLYVYDPIAGYRNNPANIIEIYISNFGSSCESHYQYTVPIGKALIITAISGREDRISDPRYNISGIYVYDSPNCGGSLLTSHFSSDSATTPTAPIAVDLGVGILVKAGKTISVSSFNNFGYTFLHGYLVPASVVPTASPAEAASEPKPITAAEVAAKEKRSTQ